MSLPILFPPQEMEGRLLVDGSLSDSCPVSAYTGSSDGPVLAVRIAGPAARHDGGVPSLGETLLRIMEIGNGRESADASAATLTVTPDTSGVGLLEFHQIDAAREAGRAAGRAAVEALLQSGILTTGTATADSRTSADNIA